MTGPEHFGPYLIRWQLIGEDGGLVEVFVHRLCEKNRWLLFVNGKLLQGEWEICQEHYSARKQEMQLHCRSGSQLFDYLFIFAIRSHEDGDFVALYDAELCLERIF